MWNIRGLACRFLTSCNTADLPFEIESIKGLDDRYVISTYEQADELLKRLGVWEHSLKSKGFTTATTEDGKKTCWIFHNSNLTYYEFKEVILHEIGHDICNHISECAVLAYSSNKEIMDKQNAEADFFALNVMAPFPVLYAMNIKTARELQVVTGIPENDAKGIFIELQEMRQQKRANWGREEKDLIRKFMPLILKYRMSKCWPSISGIGFLAVAVIVFALLRSAYSNQPPVIPTPLPQYQSPIMPAEAEQPYAENTYYWIDTKDKRAHHIYDDCSALKGKTIKSGTLEEAQLTNKSHLCEICFNRNAKETAILQKE